MPIAGFILSKHQYDIQGDLTLCYWLSTDIGPVKTLIRQEKAVFFAKRDHQAVLSQAWQDNDIVFDIKTVTLKTFSQDELIACYFSSLRDYYDAKSVAADYGITLFEDDIRHCERYLMERFIKGSCWLKGDLLKRNGYYEVVEGKLAKGDYLPQLSMLSVDLECNRQGVLFSIGMFQADYQHVIMIGDGQPEQSITWVQDEVALLHTFEALVKQLNPDVMIGWNVINFDFRLIAERCDALSISLHLARDKSRWRYKENNKINPLEIPGRVVLDGIDCLKNASYHFSSFSLAQVSHELLGETKLIEHVDRLSEIERQFSEDKVALAAYNLKDCELVWQIFEQEQLLPFLIARTQMTGLDLQRLGGSVAAFINLYLPHLHRAHFVAPNLGDNPVSFESPGGYVMESIPGFYKNVVVLDFKSLYPSIIRTFKIDPLGLIKGLEHPDTALEGYNGARFSREAHFLPELIAQLWQQRDIAKKHQDAMLSYAIKIIMNSFYGVLGSTGCRFYDPRLSSSITMRGHDIMQKTKQLIEEKGFRVIYGDTDSTFVALDDKLSLTECERHGDELANYINGWWQQHIKTQYQLDSFLEIEFETSYTPFFMPTIRGSEKGSKKRYVGKIKTGELVFKGMETVRSDWTELAREFQQQLFECYFEQKPVTEYIKDIVNKLYTGRCDKRLVYRKRLGQELAAYVKNIPPHVKAARNATLKDPNMRFSKGAWVEYIVTQSGPVIAQQNTAIIDYDHYLEKQLKPIADSLLPFLNLDFDQLLNAQGRLF